MTTQIRGVAVPCATNILYDLLTSLQRGLSSEAAARYPNARNFLRALRPHVALLINGILARKDAAAKTPALRLLVLVGAESGVITCAEILALTFVHDPAHSTQHGRLRLWAVLLESFAAAGVGCLGLSVENVFLKLESLSLEHRAAALASFEVLVLCDAQKTDIGAQVLRVLSTSWLDIGRLCLAAGRDVRGDAVCANALQLMLVLVEKQQFGGNIATLQQTCTVLVAAYLAVLETWQGKDSGGATAEALAGGAHSLLVALSHRMGMDGIVAGLLFDRAIACSKQDSKSIDRRQDVSLYVAKLPLPLPLPRTRARARFIQ